MIPSPGMALDPADNRRRGKVQMIGRNKNIERASQLPFKGKLTGLGMQMTIHLSLIHI